MKHVSYLQRVSRHIGSTAVLVPSRRLWNSTSERVPVVVEDVPVATPARSLPPRRAAVPAAPAEPYGPPGTDEQQQHHHRDSQQPPAATPAIEPMEREAADVRPPAEREEEEVHETHAPRRTRTEEPAGPAVVRPREPRVPRQAGAPASPAPEDAAPRSISQPERPAIEAGVEETGTILVPAEALEQQARIPERLATPAHAPTHARTHTHTQTPGTPGEPAVQIGAIEVHIAPPAPLRPAPAPAPKTAPGRLARGFVSTFGLRQE